MKKIITFVALSVLVFSSCSLLESEIDVADDEPVVVDGATFTEDDAKAAFAEKYPDWDLSVMPININDVREEGYASGGVGEGPGGGFWYAALTDDGWVIAADGNGDIMCADIEPYDFPADMIYGCWDEDAQEFITR